MNSSVAYDRSYNPLQSQAYTDWPSKEPSSAQAPYRPSEPSRPGSSAVGTWLRPFRDGLPTPPNHPRDMTGFGLNSVSASASNYGTQSSNFSYSSSTLQNVDASRQPYQNPTVSSAPDIYLAAGNVDSRKTSVKPQEPSQQRPQKHAIATYLQIPSSINDSKGSLAEFAAQITCLLWFESSTTLQRVEDPRISSSPVQPLVPEAMPTMGFRKWVTTILSTTQVTQSVVVLALLFIYRLKKFNPTVRGKPGSEYRLLTVALMLGNKFLDDNTYTNKTWAEVSGISVQEIHIMEVEFLSNMRYNLFTSEKQWEEWHKKLAKIWTYFDRASKLAAQPPRLQAQGPLTPILLAPPALPSPPESTHTSPPFVLNHSTPLPWPQTQHIPPYQTQSPSRLYPDMETSLNQRKRSYDEQMYGPPAKRVTRSMTPGSSIPMMTQLPHPNGVPTLPRLPVSNVTLPPTRLQPLDMNSPSVRLPPPASRAMTAVYNPAYSQASSVAPSNSTTPQLLALQTNMLPSILDHPGSRHQSPFPVSSAMSSPITSLTSHSTPQNRLSPSYFLTHRQSPYRPVQAVNRLLHPPPSASMQGPPPNLSFQNLQYQPLGKQADFRTGLAYDMGNWPHLTGQQNWPILPQPN